MQSIKCSLLMPLTQSLKTCRAIQAINVGNLANKTTESEKKICERNSISKTKLDEKNIRRSKDVGSHHKSYDGYNKEANIVNKKNITMKVKDKNCKINNANNNQHFDCHKLEQFDSNQDQNEAISQYKNKRKVDKDSQISSPNDGSSSTARDPISIPTTLQANTGMKVSCQLINDEKLCNSINKHAEENILLRKSLQDHNIDKRKYENNKINSRDPSLK